MSSLNFNYQHTPFNKTIQLYGDRTSGQGNFKFAGLAELHGIKLVLLQGNTNSLEQPADWRRFLRLIHLAQRINKPVLLWNIPLLHIATTQHISLALSTVIQNVRIQLFKLPLPIITVFDENYEFNLAIHEIEWSDGSVIVKDESDKLPNLSNIKGRNLRTADYQTDIVPHILDLLQKFSQIPGEKLVNNRLESLHYPIDFQL